MNDARFRNFVNRVAQWTDAELACVSPLQVRHVATRVMDGLDPIYPPFADEAVSEQREGEGQRSFLTYGFMPSRGRCEWKQLREAVSEAIRGVRDVEQDERSDIYTGHRMVEGMNYNSLDRIVSAFVEAALAAQRPAGLVQSQAVVEDRYLIWSNEHRAWWKPEERGYTYDIDRAGRYDRTAALKIARTRGGGWPNEENPFEIVILEKDAIAMRTLRARDGFGAVAR